ncbi:MAG TPA: hypothetical protein PLU71_01665 [Candidatus Dependentiae bacterium]|nr:hypothetical protein [Candidatus Dependentiae bacterium]HRQ62539.1 hypothetical protein [Candidatus Dependentiae bacterium]
MEFVKLLLNDRGYYSYQGASNVEMSDISFFLTDDVGCSGRESFREFALNDNETGTSSNATHLEKEDGYILLSSLHAEDLDNPIEFKIPIKMFIKLLDDWQEKVCKLKPKEVIIKHENGEFIIETKE